MLVGCVEVASCDSCCVGVRFLVVVGRVVCCLVGWSLRFGAFLDVGVFVWWGGVSFFGGFGLGAILRLCFSSDVLLFWGWWRFLSFGLVVCGLVCGVDVVMWCCVCGGGGFAVRLFFWVWF